MGGPQALITERSPERDVAGQACPRCGAAWNALPALGASILDHRPLRRCHHCGCRFSAADGPCRTVRTCSGCGLPFFTEEPYESAAEVRCGDCGRAPASVLHDAPLSTAAEAEVRAVLERHLSCVSGPAVGAYLRRLLGRLGPCLARRPPAFRVALVHEDSLETLALPSGTLILGVGLLKSVDDEAALAFVLAHEMAHVTSGDAAARLVGIGLRSLTLGEEAAGEEAWAEAAMDLVRLGYGRHNELQADKAALGALRRLGYDPGSAVRFLSRLQNRVERGDPRVQEYALAHPPASERVRAIESVLNASAEPVAETRVNREVFRRVAAPSVLAAGLAPVEGLGDGADDEAVDRRPWWRSTRVRLAAGAAFLATLVLLLSLIFLR